MEETTHNNNTTELPTIRHSFSKHINNSIIESTELEIKGMTLKECIKTFDYIREKLEGKK